MLYINAEWREADGGATFSVTNPATGEILGHAADGTAADAGAAIAAANEAFVSWSRLTAYQRSAYLFEAHQLIRERAEDLAKLMTEEQGKPLRAARFEIGYAADFLLWFAEEAKRVYGEMIPSPRADQRFLSIRQPVGVVGAITPWNYPVSMITRKVGPALAAGCTVVLKPAEQTPLCAIAVFEVLADAGLPAGVVNLVTTSDPAPVGAEFISNPAVRKLTFTGSTEVGKMLAKGAAEQMMRVSMELGGHAPFIVFEDADPSHAAKGAAMVKTLNTGQACISPNRIYVQRSILGEFVATLKERIERMRAGSGLQDGVSIGPLVDEPSLAKVDRQVQDAIAKGAELVTGGRRLVDDGLGEGWFYAPTVLNGVTPDMLIYREETFGPVAAVIPFDTEEEVLEKANDTEYGLASYVYTQDLSRAIRVFEALRFGIVGINDINPTAAAVPFGGMKNSGLGREGGHEGITDYLETKVAGISI